MTQELIPVEKDGEYIEVHPSTIEQHKQLGWKVTEKRVPADDDSSGNSKLTVDEIKAKLTAAGIEFQGSAKKADLVALLPAE